MARAHSHYDNLKVARNAPTEVIRAAYRVLAQRYHPDVNTSPDAARVMKLLNEAWDVLGDPEKRAKHDAWLQEQDRLAGDNGTKSSRPPDFESSRTYTYTYTSQAKPRPPSSETRTSPGKPSNEASEGFRHAADGAKNRKPGSPSRMNPPAAPTRSNTDGQRASLNNWIGFLALGALVVAIAFSMRSNSPSDPSRQKQQPLAAQSANTRSTNSLIDRCKGSYEVEKCEELARRLLEETPDQRRERQESLEATRHGPVAVPQASRSSRDSSSSAQRDREQLTRTGYVPGSPRGASGGLSDFTVDNTSGGGDAIARLYLSGRKPAVRTFFIRKGERFTASSLAPGVYVLRYRYIGSEETYEADREFALKQFETEGGTNYSRVKVTLYKVWDGNMQSKSVPQDSF